MDTLQIVFYIFAGASVGFAIGLTGVGGGSLMTPLLIFVFHIPPQVAVGTDLLFAAVTKSGGVLSHQKLGSIRWRLVFLLGAGSIPPSVLLHIFVLNDVEASQFSNLLTVSLGLMLILTSMVLIFRTRIRDLATRPGSLLARWGQDHTSFLTFIIGFFLGVFVTLSSVGAGAFATAALMLLYPRMTGLNIVGTDIAHAVPLTFIAGLGYFYHGHVDLWLLGALLVGSLPAIFLGARLAARLPDRVLHPVLASIQVRFLLKLSDFRVGDTVDHMPRRHMPAG